MEKKEINTTTKTELWMLLVNKKHCIVLPKTLLRLLFPVMEKLFLLLLFVNFIVELCIIDFH